MLSRSHGQIEFECDACGEVLQTSEREFAEAKAVLDDEGWRARKIGSDWIHRCDDCAGDWA